MDLHCCRGRSRDIQQPNDVRDEKEEEVRERRES